MQLVESVIVGYTLSIKDVLEVLGRTITKKLKRSFNISSNNKTDYAIARNKEYRRDQVGNIERHNERKNEHYQNVDILVEEKDNNIYFKKPTNTYLNMFDDMCDKKIISTRGLKQDAVIIDELMFDVNTEYFENNGGIEFAEEFLKKAYEYAIKEVGGEEFILSAIMHCDERNQAVSEKLGKDVFHYHLHVVYVPVVQKEIKWTKRCKDKDLVGKVKEVVNQVSHSKKWASHKVSDDDGNSYLEKSYSLLQDRFYEYMLNQGYDDIQRGEKGSTTKNLTTTQYKAKQEEKKLEKNVEKVFESETILNQQQDEIEENTSIIKEQVNEIEKISNTKSTIKSIDNIETKEFLFDKDKCIVNKAEFNEVKELAKVQIANKNKEIKFKNSNKQLKKDNSKLKEQIGGLKKQVNTLDIEIAEYKSAVYELKEDKKILINNQKILCKRVEVQQTKLSTFKSVVSNFISYLLDIEKFLIKNKLIDLLIDLLTPSKFIQSQEEIIEPPKKEISIQPKKKRRSMER